MSNQQHDEVWLPLPGYKGLYEISHLGRVRSLHVRFKEPRLCAQGNDGTGYKMVSLSKEGRRTAKTVHRLVCRAFHGEPDMLHNEAAHLDGDRTNNHASNRGGAAKSRTTLIRDFTALIRRVSDIPERNSPKRPRTSRSKGLRPGRRARRWLTRLLSLEVRSKIFGSARNGVISEALRRPMLLPSTQGAPETVNSGRRTTTLS
jgi:hypothetical protein